MTDSFWTDGPAAYEKGLKQQFEALQKALQKKLAACNDPTTRQKIEYELYDLEKLYHQKLNGSDHNIH